MKLDKVKLMYIFLLLQPIIDLITGIMTKYEIGFISIGIIFRGIFILCMVIYLFFFCNTKYKKVSIIYVFLLGIYTIIYFLTKTELLINRTFLINDLIYLFKYLYFLVLFVTLFNFYIQYKLDYKKILKIFLIDLIMYIIFILIPLITNTSFSSYMGKNGEGVVGWFYAANDISNIFVLLFPILIYYLDKKIDIWKIILILLTLICSLLIGTKVSYFGVILGLILSIFYYCFSIKKKWKQELILICILIFYLLIGNNSYVVKNIKNRSKKYDQYQETHVNKYEGKNDIYITDDDSKVSIVIFSSRDRMLKETYEIYQTRDLKEKLFGIGFSNRKSINDLRIEKLVEIDLFDILFHCGIILVILYCIPFLLIIIYFIKYFMRNRLKIHLRGWIYGYLICLGFGASLTSGHLFSSPSVLIYYTLIIIMFLEYFRVEKIIKKKKLSFLLLHLENGGIENATVNTANALEKYYNIELVVTYKLSNEKLYNINKNIKIKYLIDNDISIRMTKYKELFRNKKYKELLSTIYNDYIKQIKIKKLLNDIYNSCKVIILKKKLMIDYINKCDSDIIISTRNEFSVYLSKYGNPNSIKIAVEHRHHNNDKRYIKSIRNKYDNINYLVVLTEGLKKDYNNFLKKDSNTKVVCIPNMLINYPNELATLNEKRIISIGRIVNGKRVDEIIKIAMQLKEYEFVIVGDGEKFDEIKKIIEDKNVNNVKLLGAMKNKDALNELKKSSIFIMTSETEGLPMVLLEACSYGLPIVAYETDSGVNDIVDDGINGYVIKKRNQEEMIKRLKELMNNYHKRKKFGKKAYQKSLLFSEKEIIKKWLEIL